MALQTRTCCIRNDTRIIFTLVAIIITINYIFILIIISKIFITVEILTS